MNVKIMKPYGFCAGVEYVLKTIQQVMKDHEGETIYCIGQIVHNISVNEGIRNQGVIVFEGNKEEIIEKIEKGVVIFSAHGTSQKVIQRAKEKGLIVYDAACPFVKKEMKDIYDYLTEGYEIIFVGIREHDEANAILSISSKIHLITSIEDIENTIISTDKIVIVNQTTLSVDNLKKIHQAILNKFSTAIIADEICNSSKIRQHNLKKIAKDFDLIIVVGDKHSNNTMTLYKEAKSKNSNVVLCSSHDTLNIEQCASAKDILVVSGASVPKKRVEEIVLMIKKFEK